MAQYLNFNNIKDSCSQLTSLSESLNSTIDSINTSISEIKDPAWGGIASESFRKKITTLSNNLPDAKRQLALSVLFLTSCADGYDALGKESVNKLKELIGKDYINTYKVNNAPNVDLTSRYKQEYTQETTTPVAHYEDYTEYKYNTSFTRADSGAPSGTEYVEREAYLASTYAEPTPVQVISDSSSQTSSSLTNLQTTSNTLKTVEIPQSVRQGYYTVTGYDYWLDSGKEMVWSPSSNQRVVSDMWKKQGSVFKNGIAVINVDGVDRYIIAVTTKFGQAGDCINVQLQDGTVVPCIIGDSKGDGSGSGSEWGHALPGGLVNVLEFEAQRSKLKSSGNPTTEDWGLPWNSSSPVQSMTNIGSIIGATEIGKGG